MNEVAHNVMCNDHGFKNMTGVIAFGVSAAHTFELSFHTKPDAWGKKKE